MKHFLVAETMGLQLFDGSDSDNDNSKIEINRDYAKKFEHNKKREDLQRLEELKKKGLIEDSESESSESESSSSEEEDTQNFRKDLEFFDALIKVKKQDPALKQKEAKLFDSDDDSHGKESNDVKGSLIEKKKSSMYLKDVVAKHLIEEGPEFNDEKTNMVKVYDKEQEEIRKAFLEAAEVQDEDEEELLKVKERGVVEEEKDEEFERKLDEYFGDGDDQLDENSKFLKEYFKNKLWRSEDAKVGEEELNMLSEDEEEIEKQEEYEYRFQENVGDTIWGHNRTVEGSVRKKKNSRKEQRKSKEERMEIARLEREEELKHLKNLKKEEVKEKLRKIRETAGLGEDENCLLDIKDFDEDFDPEEYDRMMKRAFSEEYYEKEDIDPGFGSDMDDEGDGEIEKPDFDKEDELLGLPKGWASSESGDGFLAARQRSLKHKIDNDMSNEDNEEDEEQGNEDEKSKRKRKRKLSLYKKAKEAMMEEYYKLDYEDTVGDLKTRFKYAKIPPNRYGLSTAEILALDDKELNQFVSMKKLAPYKEEWKMPNSTRQRLKMRSRELLRGKQFGEQKDIVKKRVKDGSNMHILDDNENDKVQIEDPNVDKGNLSRKARRKQRQAELKLSHFRNLAYGKTTSKPKKKSKH